MFTVEPPSAISESTMRTAAAISAMTMSVSNVASNPCGDELTSAGTTNGTRAPGGYSTLKSRYGTSPLAIRSP